MFLFQRKWIYILEIEVMSWQLNGSLNEGPSDPEADDIPMCYRVSHLNNIFFLITGTALVDGTSS